MNQPTLLPDAPPTTELRQIDPWQVLYRPVGPDPDPALLRSIQRFGILTPITVHATVKRALPYRLISGRRRLLAAQRLTLETVPALVITGEYEAVPALSDHALRKDNPAAELVYIEQLIEQGALIPEIASATGLPIQTIKARLRLQHLVPKLREAFKDGRIGVSVAESAAKLPVGVQDTLVEKIGQDGKLTLRDVKDAQRVRATDAAKELPWGVLEGTPNPADEDYTDDFTPIEMQAVCGVKDWGLEYWETQVVSAINLLSEGNVPEATRQLEILLTQGKEPR